MQANFAPNMLLVALLFPVRRGYPGWKRLGPAQGHERLAAFAAPAIYTLSSCARACPRRCRPSRWRTVRHWPSSGPGIETR